MNEREYELAKLKEELESKYHEGYIDGKAFKDRHITLRDHFAGLAMQGMTDPQPKFYCTADIDSVAELAYKQADAMLAERGKNEN